MKIEDLYRKLRPIHGVKVDKLYQLWLLESTDGRREIEFMFNTLFQQTFKQPLVLDEKSDLEPPEIDAVHGEYPLGEISYSGHEIGPFGLREKDWIKHVLIVGASGSGKTNLSFQILKNFLLKGKPFLVFDWKRNYRDVLSKDYGKQIEVYTPGRTTVPFRFNPLIPPKGTSPQTWLKKLIEIIAHATFVGEGVMYLLQKALQTTYEKFGVYDSLTPETYPTLKDLLATVRDIPVKGREAGWMSSTLRALESLTFGETGKIFDIQSQADLSMLLTKPVILEMDSLTNADKTFLVESILLWIHHYRMESSNTQRESFEHAIILEEAHHIIGKEKSDLTGGEAVTDIIIREIRELGESVIIIDQCPSLLSLPARANTWTTIVLNLKDAIDVNSAASAILLDSKDKKTLGRLDVGEAIVKLQGRWYKPFSIKIPYVNIKKGEISDQDLKNRFGPFSVVESVEPVKSQALSPSYDEVSTRQINGLTERAEQRKLLEDIARYKISGVVERYKRLKWSRRKGNTHKENLINAGLITPVEVFTKSGRVVLLQLSEEGRIELGLNPKADNRRGSVTHEYWKQQYAKYYQNQGYSVEIEKAIGEGKTVDLLATNDDQVIAIEIETGKSDILANIKKCLTQPYQRIILVAINEKVEEMIMRLLDENHLSTNKHIKLLCARRGEYE